MANLASVWGTRGKTINFIIDHTKITGSRHLDVLVSGHCCHNVKNVKSLCSKVLDKDHKHYFIY